MSSPIKAALQKKNVAPDVCDNILSFVECYVPEGLPVAAWKKVLADKVCGRCPGREPSIPFIRAEIARWTALGALNWHAYEQDCSPGSVNLSACELRADLAPTLRLVGQTVWVECWYLNPFEDWASKWRDYALIDEVKPTLALISGTTTFWPSFDRLVLARVPYAFWHDSSDAEL